MYQQIKSILIHACAKLYDVELEPAQIVLEKPKNKELGHIATPLAFSLAKLTRANPKLIAQELCETLQAQSSKEFSKIEALNGFVNLTLSAPFLIQCAKSSSIHHGAQFRLGSGLDSKPKPQNSESSKEAKEKILIEYVSANPTGPLHIGHARGAVYGDSLARVGRFLGYEIGTEYYINDAGAQIGLLGLSLLLAGREHILGQSVVYPESYYKGEYIVDLAKEAYHALGADIFEREESEAIALLADFGKEAMLSEIKDNLAQARIYFDYYVSEKSLYPQWEQTLETLEQNKGAYHQDGKVWIASSAHSDEKDRVIVRESGEPTYLAGDIIYHGDKFKRGYDRYINIWGADHHGYIARVRAAIAYLGYDESRLEVLLSQMVSLLKDGQPYKMSKRAGNFILMGDVLDEIGADALRYIFLSKKPDTHLEFDVDELKKQDSTNPIYYINYANARIHTLLEKAGVSLETALSHTGLDVESSSESRLDSELLEAQMLLFEALLLPQVLDLSFRDREMQKICEYLKTLAASLHGFYNAHKIIGSEHEAYLLYVFAHVSLSLTLGLGLLGIEAKRKM